MISSCDQRRIFLLPGRPDQTWNPGLQDISTMVKQDQQDLPLCRQIPIGAAHISFSGQHRMRLATSKTNPQVAPRWPRRQLSSDQHLDKHWPGGAKIKMTLELADPREKEARWQMVKPRLGIAGKDLIKANYQGVPIITQPRKERKSGNITPI